MNDIHGTAILDAYLGKTEDELILHNSYGPTETMPVEVFLREQEDFTELERQALLACKGHILDVGAGAGAHSLVLQSWGRSVRALEVSGGCLDVMKRSGVADICPGDFFAHTGSYDTVLLLMNGVGIVGKLERFSLLMEQCSRLLNAGGQLLLDSSDISYLYEEGSMPADRYFGEVQFQYEYKGSKGAWFDWVYIDRTTMADAVESLGLTMEIVSEDEFGQFLARISGW